MVSVPSTQAKRIVIFGWAESVHIQRWASGLAERGFEIKVISLDGDEVAGRKTVVFPRKSRWSYIRHASAAAREALAFEPDLVHVHYVGGFGLWGLRTRFMPLLVSVWGSDLIEGKRGLLKRKLLRRTFRQATHITATSHFLKDETVRIFRGAVKKLTIIPFGVDVVDRYDDLPPTDEIRLCYIKLHKYVYGPDVLIEAVVRARKEIPNLRLSLAGRGTMTAQLEKLVRRHALEKYVEFNGYIDNRDIYSFIKKHHMVAVPSRQEAFGVAALEGSMCGRPVIATSVGGLPEVIRHDETGLLVPPDDPDKLAEAIVRLARSPELMRKMGQAGHAYAKESFAWRDSLDRMSRLYEGLINAAQES